MLILERGTHLTPSISTICNKNSSVNIILYGTVHTCVTYGHHVLLTETTRLGKTHEARENPRGKGKPTRPGKTHATSYGHHVFLT